MSDDKKPDLRKEIDRGIAKTIFAIIALAVIGFVAYGIYSNNPDLRALERAQRESERY